MTQKPLDLITLQQRVSGKLASLFPELRWEWFGHRRYHLAHGRDLTRTVPITVGSRMGRSLEAVC